MNENMDIRLIALDLDGTLTNSEKIVTQRTKEAIWAAMDKGVEVVLASGRLTQGIEFIAKELELYERGGYILSYNGAYVVELKSGEVFHQRLLDPAFVPELCAFAKEQEVAIATFRPDGLFLTDTEGDRYFMEDARNCRCPITPVEDLEKEVTFPIPKMLLSVEPSRLAEVEEAMAKQFAGRIDVYHSSPFFLEAMPLNCTKGGTLAILLEKLGLRAEQLMACGDSANDLDMIRLAGLGVAMDNADADVKAVAQFVSADNDHDGVALAIETFIL